LALVGVLTAALIVVAFGVPALAVVLYRLARAGPLQATLMVLFAR